MAIYDKNGNNTVVMGDHPYNDMRIGVPTRTKLTKNMQLKLDKEYARLGQKTKNKKQQDQYLRSVYYRSA